MNLIGLLVVLAFANIVSAGFWAEVKVWMNAGAKPAERAAAKQALKEYGKKYLKETLKMGIMAGVGIGGAELANHFAKQNAEEMNKKIDEVNKNNQDLANAVAKENDKRDAATQQTLQNLNDRITVDEQFLTKLLKYTTVQSLADHIPDSMITKEIASEAKQKHLKPKVYLAQLIIAQRKKKAQEAAQQLTDPTQEDPSQTSQQQPGEDTSSASSSSAGETLPS